MQDTSFSRDERSCILKRTKPRNVGYGFFEGLKKLYPKKNEIRKIGYIIPKGPKKWYPKKNEIRKIGYIIPERRKKWYPRNDKFRNIGYYAGCVVSGTAKCPALRKESHGNLSSGSCKEPKRERKRINGIKS